MESGSLPDGLTLDSFTGAITGTATATGVFDFAVRARENDPVGAGLALPFRITIVDAPHKTHLPLVVHR